MKDRGIGENRKGRRAGKPEAESLEEKEVRGRRKLGAEQRGGPEMEIRKELYQALVNRNPAIRKRYHALRQQKQGKLGRMYAWGALLAMNLSRILRPQKWERLFFDPDAGKAPPEGRSESSLSGREPPEVLAGRLAAYDVITFDVFDTLLFRPFSSPTDLFFAVGEKLGYLDFERIRREMEWRARQKAKEGRGSYEVTLEEIYAELEEQAGIPKERGMQAEAAMEEALCFANPYMTEVLRCLRGCGKKILCLSDMYLPSAVIRRMVEKCGYQGIDDYYVSCEQNSSKGEGGLYERVKEHYGREKRYIHVGDHPVSDVEMAGKHGFAAELYRNVNMAGMPYRAEDLSAVTGSLYRGLVNARLHNGLHVYSREYELGFVYGGLFAVGYCQFIHAYVKCHEIDRILFLSRDGDILYQVYGMLYPEEAGEGRTAYAYWSRLAAAKLGAGYFKYDYLRRFVDHKVNQGYTLRQVFESMELEDMLPGLGGELTPKACLTDRNALRVKEYLNLHWREVLSHYEGQAEAGGRYYREVLWGCKRVAAVDVGWAGSGAVVLDHMVNRVWELGCEVVGILGGTNTIHNAEPDMSESQLASGKLVSWLYSQGHNRDLWKWHDASKDHNLCVELLCGSAQGSLKGFYPKGEGYELRFKEPDVDKEIVGEIQRGIRDFAGRMIRLREAMGRELRISGRDAYGVLRILLRSGYKKVVREMAAQEKGVEMETGI